MMDDDDDDKSDFFLHSIYTMIMCEEHRKKNENRSVDISWCLGYICEITFDNRKQNKKTSVYPKKKKKKIKNWKGKQKAKVS